MVLLIFHIFPCENIQDNIFALLEEAKSSVQITTIWHRTVVGFINKGGGEMYRNLNEQFFNALLK